MPIYRGAGGSGDSSTDSYANELYGYTQTAITKANEASSSATDSANSATDAANSATNAANSATASANSATAAANSAAEAEAAKEAIDGLYLGTLPANPTVDSNGDPVTVGDWYFNSTDNTTRIYDGTSWQTINPDLIGDTTPQLGGNLDVNGNDINFGDNAKAVFGAGSDLQIYHDSATSTNKIIGSFDVTGSVVSDGATIAGTLELDSNNFDHTGLTPQYNMIESDVVGNNTQFLQTAGDLRIRTVDDSLANPVERLRIDHATGDISFYEDTGTTAKLFWDASAESLGIGTSSISTSKLHVQGTNGIASAIRVESTAVDSDAYYIADNDGSVWTWGIDGGVSDAWILSNAFGLGTPKITVLPSGNVGIGTSTNLANGTLNVESNGTSVLQARSDTAGVNDGDTTVTALRGVNSTAAKWANTNYYAYSHKWGIGSGASSNSAMTLDASGNLLVGTTSPVANVGGLSVNATGSFHCASFQAGGNGYGIVIRNSGGTIVGSIIMGASATTYNTSSDQRLKDNIVDAPSASDDIDAIQVRSFDWKADGSHQKYGMVAQELVTVAPEAVSQPEDPEEMMGVDYSKLVPMLIKEVQQLRARVAQLEGAN